MMINSILTRIQGPMGHWSSSPVKTCLILMFATRGYSFPCRELDFEHSNRWNAALFIQLGLNYVSVILSQRRNTSYISTIPNLKKIRIFFLLQNWFEMEIWNVYTLCCKDLKRAPLPDIFFCVKNMTKIKYHADVIMFS